MSLAQSAALAFVMGQHVTEEKDRQRPEVSVVVTMVPKPSKASAKVKQMGNVFPIQGSTATKDVVTAPVIPTIAKLDGKGFLVAMRNAKTREERIGIITAYTGYDNAQNYGSQLLVAEMKAKKELRVGPIPGPSREEQRSAWRSASGFVAGIPDNAQKQLNDLLGREKVAAEALIQHTKDSTDLKRSSDDRTLSKGLADFEKDRLEHIRSDLKALGFGD